MKADRKNFSDIKTYCVLVLDPKDPRYFEYYTAITFARDAKHAINRVRLFWPDSRREKLYALPIEHESARRMIEREGVTVEAEVARYAALEADASTKVALARTRARRRRTSAAREPVVTPAPLPVDPSAPQVPVEPFKVKRRDETLTQAQARKSEAQAEPQLTAVEARTLRNMLERGMHPGEALKYCRQVTMQEAFGGRPQAPLEVLKGSDVAREFSSGESVHAAAERSQAERAEASLQAVPRKLADKTVEQLHAELEQLQERQAREPKAGFVLASMISAREAELAKRAGPDVAEAVAETEGAQLQQAEAEAREPAPKLPEALQAKPKQPKRAAKATARHVAKRGRPAKKGKRA